MNTQINDSHLDEIVKKLVEHFNPTKIFLFGSRAKGTARPESDYDLFLVVKESHKKPIQRMQEANRLFWGDKAAIDIFIYTEAEYDEWKDEMSSIAHTVATEGLELQVG